MRKLLILLSAFTITAKVSASVLPKDLKWINNNNLPEFSSPKAKKGGTFRVMLQSFPLTLRTVGPDSNGSFRGVILDNFMGLVSTHPNTRDYIPALAKDWAFDENHKTVYFKLNPKAKWSDGKPVTVDDFLFTLEMMKSKFIVAPWYNNHYNEYFEKIVKYDDYTMAFVGKKKLDHTGIMENMAIAPMPKHFYGKLGKDFVRKFNWKIIPNTGAYIIDKVKKGKSVTLKRNKNWWAKDLKFYRNRYNVDRIKFVLVRDMNVAFEYFKKGKLDSFGLTLPRFWHDKSLVKDYKKGYMHRLWFYTDSPISPLGFYLNTAKKPFQDLNVRLGLAHALNVEKVIKTVLRNDYLRLQRVSDGYGDFTNRKIKARKFDLKKADFYFKKAGWSKRGPDGIRIKGKERLSVTLINIYPHHLDRLTIIKEEAKKAGFEIKIRPMDPAAGFKAYKEKQHQLAYMGWSTSRRPSYWQGYHSDNANKPQTNNISNFSDKKTDQLITNYRNTFNEDEKIKLAHEIQQEIHDKVPFIPSFKAPFFRSMYWSWWKLPQTPGTRLSQMAFEPFGELGGLFWLDKEEKKKVKAARKKGKPLPQTTIINKDFMVN